MRASTQPHGPGYPHDPALLARIQAFPLDPPGAAFPFSVRLAREQGWTRAHALRVIAEYRHFLYLAATAGHPVSPSPAVDEAWHLHLTCTRSYWDGLCAGVLGRPLHHDPSRGGLAEREKHADLYARTLAAYAAAFGEAPPPDLWPAPGAPPAPAEPAPSRDTHWIVRKPRLRSAAGAALAAAAAAALVAGCARADEEGRAALVFAGAAVLVLVLLYRATRAFTPSRPGWRRAPGGAPVVGAVAAGSAVAAAGGGRRKREEDGAAADGCGGSADADSRGGDDCGDGGGGDAGGCSGGGCSGGCAGGG